MRVGLLHKRIRSSVMWEMISNEATLGTQRERLPDWSKQVSRDQNGYGGTVTVTSNVSLDVPTKREIGSGNTRRQDLTLHAARVSKR